jgi:hypothetical protein
MTNTKGGNIKVYTSRSKMFFAAANGFHGFRSNFDKIFKTEKMDKMFVIKGGPGTGKSTLMKRLAKKFEHKADITNILCSSDPNSLDGVILSKDGVCVGIADGTAPHIIDPVYPGAFEEIINLGEGFNFEGLRQCKSEIIALTRCKKTEYEKAYSTLYLAGEVFDYISSIIPKEEIYSAAESIVGDAFLKDDHFDFGVDNRYYLIGAFCKDGYKRLPLKNDQKKIEEHLNKIASVMESTPKSDALDALCNLLFPEELSEYLAKHRPKDARQLREEIACLREELGETTRQMNQQVQAMADTMKAMLEASVPIEEIEQELLMLDYNEAIGVFKQLNTLLLNNKAWVNNAGSIRSKIYQLKNQSKGGDTYNYASGATHYDGRRTLNIKQKDESNLLE